MMLRILTRFLSFQLKKLEERGRAAFIQGDLTAATRFFTRALEKRGVSTGQGSDAHKTSPELKRDIQRKDAVRTKCKMSPQPTYRNDEEKVWILQSSNRSSLRDNRLEQCTEFLDSEPLGPLSSGFDKLLFSQRKIF